MVSRLSYYLHSIPTLLAGIRNWPGMLILFTRKNPFVIRLVGGLSFKIRTPMDAWIVKETCLDDCYRVRGAGLQPGWNVVDIGAGVGDFAIYVGKQHPEVRVFAFEPAPSSFSLLEENLRLNATGNVRIFPMAVGARSERMRLSTHGEATHSTTAGSPPGTAEIDVQGLALNDLFQRMNIEYLHFMKIDCEGGEYEILLNASQATLEKIGRIEMEYHDEMTPHSHPELVEHLHAAGFQVQITPSPVHRHLGYISAARTG